jgi:hypothetical protein
MKMILTERKYRIPFHTNPGRCRYLERVVAQLNNELIEDGLTPADRSRFYNSLLSAVKHIHEFKTDAQLEDLERRIEAIENERKP